MDRVDVFQTGLDDDDSVDIFVDDKFHAVLLHKSNLNDGNNINLKENNESEK